MKTSRAAFTLVELLVAACVSVVLAGIIYTMGSEALFSFTRNVSLNRCYSDARKSLDRIGQVMTGAGHVPVLINEDGSAWSASANNNSEAAGIRFYCYGVQPSYQLTSCQSSSSGITVTIPTGAAPPRVGDLVLVGAVGFQALVSGVSGSGTSRTLTLTDMNGTAQTNGVLCNPDITTSTDITATQSYCLIFNRVAFVAVSKPALASPAAAPTTSNVTAATSTELRFYSDAANLLDSTKRDLTANYKVMANLVYDTNDTQENFIQRPRPFEILSSPAVAVTLCVQAADYSNRVSVISNANSFTRVQTSLASRCPIMLQGPY